MGIRAGVEDFAASAWVTATMVVSGKISKSRKSDNNDSLSADC
ncbi:hypothetical protein [Bradyrhizobium sp. SZCCHNR2032]